MKHRPEIDGLRAYAVLPIVLFHAGVAQLAGGFVGVDVFFVISGFLITSIIQAEMDQGRFSMLAFYRRRAVRILPALVVVLAAVLVAGCILLLPREVANLGSSAAATAAFLSNIYFWQAADYFAPDSETIPLLHTWSLGVEEQFYIFYPLFLILMRRFAPGRIREGLAAVALISFAAGAAMAMWRPEAGFYLLPSRAWEMMLGSLVALGAYPRFQSARARGGLAVAGATLIGLAVVFVRADMPFPVPWALLPSVGTAVVIAYGAGTGAGRVLSWRPLRAIGLISYSLYLWHWPIITFYRLATGNHLDPMETVGLVGASVVLATLSYWFVEQPFLRRFRNTPSGPALVVTGAVLMATIAVAALASVNSSNWRSFSPTVLRIAEYEGYATTGEFRYQYTRGPCFRGAAESNVPFDPELCTKLSDEKPNVVVLGDSHAAQYWRAFALKYPDRNVLQATGSGCRPLLGGKGSARCREAIDYVLGPLLESRRVDTIILAGQWRADELPLFTATISRIRAAGTKIIVIGPGVEYQGAFPAILARARMRGDERIAAQQRVQDPADLDERMAAQMRAAGVRYISVQAIECPAGRCRLTAPGGAPMHFDYGHLTLPAARWMVSQMPPL